MSSCVSSVELTVLCIDLPANNRRLLCALSSLDERRFPVGLIFKNVFIIIISSTNKYRKTQKLYAYFSVTHLNAVPPPTCKLYSKRSQHRSMAGLHIARYIIDTHWYSVPRANITGARKCRITKGHADKTRQQILMTTERELAICRSQALGFILPPSYSAGV